MAKCTIVTLCAAVTCVVAVASAQDWWNPKWRFRTAVTRPTPYRDDVPRPVEVAVDFPLLLQEAGIRAELDPASLRVVEPAPGGPQELPFAYRTEFDPRQEREQTYLAWITRPQVGEIGSAHIYFGTREANVEAAQYAAIGLPAENLLANPSFEEAPDGLPTGWDVTPTELVGLDRSGHTTGERSVRIRVDETTPDDVGREVSISQEVDVRDFAGQEVLFECDLMAERATYGAPMTAELQQFREDGSRIREYAIQPRWLTVELAEGQLVHLSERGRFSKEAATVNVRLRFRCYVRDADSGETVGGPESHFTVWLDRVVLRPGERRPWPAATNAGFVEGALDDAPVNRGFEFTGRRRLAFNGGSEGTRTASEYGDAKSVHWGLQAGTLEFWCRPSWNADDGQEHVFFYGIAYGHRLQSRLRKCSADGGNRLEFTILDSAQKAHTVGGPAELRAGQWHHIAATWDLPETQLQLFVDGQRIGSEGPSGDPWPFALTHTVEGMGKGIGISEEDCRSMPMQAFIGGDRGWTERTSAEAVIDEFRISDVVRYPGAFSPPRQEFPVDESTRVLFHLENERHGIHDSDDRFVRGYLACELPRQQQEAVVEVLRGDKIETRVAVLKPHPTEEMFEANRAENRMTARRPFRELPDPRFVEYRQQDIERLVSGEDSGFELQVGGDLPPLMRHVTFEHAEGTGAETTLLPRWRANDNVVPFSVRTIGETLAPDVADDAEKAFQVFSYSLETTNYYDAHYCETVGGRHRPRVSYTLIKALNIYPFDQCGPMNHMLRKLFLAAGVSSNNASGTHHQFEQAFHQGSLRLYDLSSRVYWLERDNRTALSRRELEDDPYLKIRQGGDANAWLPGRRSRATFGTAERPHNMDFPLRAGERASICWQNEGRWFELTEDRKRIPLAKIPPYFGNGAIIYEPTAAGEAAVLENMAIEAVDDGATVLRAQDDAKPASLIYHAHCPYIFSDGSVAGSYEASQPGAVKLSLSFDEGATWTEVWQSQSQAGEIDADLTDHVMARYAYWLKVELASRWAAKVTGLKVRTVLVASPLSLPGKLSLGTNRITFVGGPVTAPVKTSCSWVERYKTDLGVSLNALSYYNMDDEAHRNLLIAAPGEELPVEVTLQGRRWSGEVSLEGLPEGWTAEPGSQPVELAGPKAQGAATFKVRSVDEAEAAIRAFEVVLRQPNAERRVPVQVLVARAPLAREAELADETGGEVRSMDLVELSGARGMQFTGDGSLAFDLEGEGEGTHALWLRARWEPGSSTAMKLTVDEGEPRNLRATAMIGFTDWTDARAAHTKMFAHYGEQYGHWAWYRVPDVELTSGKRRLTIAAAGGACFDAVVLLPQNPVMDRAAMNLFQNWNFAPWDTPL